MIKKIIKAVVIIGILFFVNKLNAQSLDTNNIDSTKVLYYNSYTLDTSLYKYENVYIYDIFGQEVYQPLDKSQTFYSSAASLGSAYKPLLFSNPVDKTLNLGLNQYNDYRYRYDNRFYLLPMYSYAQLDYAHGYNREEIFRTRLSQKLPHGFSVMADYNIIKSPGRSYFQSKNNLHSLDLGAGYISKNNMYQVNIHYLRNNFTFQENGGITSDSLFINSAAYRTSPGYNLEDAQTSFKENSIYMHQHLDLSRRSKIDSLNNKRGFNLGRFSHRLVYNKQQRIFTDSDPLSEYYTAMAHDTNSTYDSLFYRIFSNELLWTNSSRLDSTYPNTLQLFFSAKHDFINIGDSIFSSDFSYFSLNSGFKLRVLKPLDIYSNLSYFIGHYKTNDIIFNAGLNYKLNENISLDFNQLFNRTEANWLDKHFHGNHYNYDIEFGKINTLESKLRINIYDVIIDVKYSNISNYIYRDTSFTPQQLSSGINVVSMELKKHFKLWNLLHIDNSFLLQYTDSPDIIRMPLFASRNSIYFNFNMFKKALKVSSGVTLKYNTAYYADAYSVEHGAFGHQNTVEIGNYPYLDVFINARIKRALFFVKYNHFNSSFSGNNYFLLPYYPQQQASLQWGISWNFFD